MNAASPFRPLAVVSLLTAAVFTLTALAQQSAPAAVPQPAPKPQTPRTYPAPVNLKVLPKTMTGQQVHDIMEQWEADLGAHCSTCHTPNPNDIGPNGKPRLNFVDDSKEEKQTARLMYTMTESINRDTISKIENSGAPVTCGTCHRGHLGPEPYKAPEEHHNHPESTVVPVK